MRFSEVIGIPHERLLRIFIDDEDLGPVDRKFGMLNLLIDFENVFRTIFLPGRMPQLVSLVNQGARRKLLDSLDPAVWCGEEGGEGYLAFRPRQWRASLGSLLS